jgi:hypothetical protein
MISAPRAAAACLVALALAGTLAACNQPSSGARSHASAAALAACSHRADQVYNIQNPADKYRADSYETNDRDSPFASTGFSGNMSAGLGGLYHREQLEDDCLSSSGEGAPSPVPEPASGPGGATPPAHPAP